MCRYRLERNIDRVFAKFRHEGRATIRLRSPAVDIVVGKANPDELDAFLTTLYLVHTAPDRLRLLPGTAMLQLNPVTKERMAFENQQKLSVGPERDLWVSHNNNPLLATDAPNVFHAP